MGLLSQMGCKFRFLCLFFVAVSFSSQAKADLLVEPYLGYGVGSLTGNYNSGGDLKYNTSGLNLGTRVAYALPIFSFGLDYDLGLSSANVTSNSSTAAAQFTNTSLTRSTLYAYVGAHVPLFRLWLGYGFLNSFNFASSGSYSSRTFGGSAWKIGAGFTGLPFVDLNLEFIQSAFNSYHDGSTESVASGTHTFKTASDSTLMFSVSLPLIF